MADRLATTTTNDLLEAYAALVSPGHVEALSSIGLDIVEASREGPFVFDADGKRYIDGITSAGTFNLGRRHPELVAELRRAVRETDQGNFPMISSEKARLAERLAELVSGKLECTVFSVVRGESVDFACKLARGYTGRKELLSVRGGWHGQTGFALGLSERVDRDLFKPLVPETLAIPFGDLDAAARAISERTAAVVLEPIQAENHCREARAGYLSGLRELCSSRGAVLVFDETQTGMGRTGSRFAFQPAGVSPDVLVLGEAIGGGIFPIAATVFTQRLNSFMNEHPLIHLSTFGGSDLGCRVAVKALEIYQRDQPWRNAAALGGEIAARFARLAEDAGSPIQSVAGRGLLLSLDLGTAERARQFCRSAAGHGLLVMPGQVAKHTVVLRPSLLIDASQAEAICAAVSNAADAVALAR